jgi:hypothetical protein
MAWCDEQAWSGRAQATGQACQPGCWARQVAKVLTVDDKSQTVGLRQGAAAT